MASYRHFLGLSCNLPTPHHRHGGGRLHNEYLGKEDCTMRPRNICGGYTSGYKCLTLLTNHCKFPGDSSQVTNETCFNDPASDCITVRFGYTLVIKCVIEESSIHSQINISSWKQKLPTVCQHSWYWFRWSEMMMTAPLHMEFHGGWCGILNFSVGTCTSEPAYALIAIWTMTKTLLQSAQSFLVLLALYQIIACTAYSGTPMKWNVKQVQKVFNIPGVCRNRGLVQTLNCW